MQTGTIFQKGRSWFLRYREPAGLKDGKPISREVCKRLAPVDNRYKSKRSVELLAKPYLDRVNSASKSPDASQRLADFIEYVYFPTVRKRRSTIFGYRHIFEHHLKPRLGDIRIWDFTVADGHRLLQAIAHDNHLGSKTLKNIKAFLTGLFTFARNEGGLKLPENPMWDVSLPKGKAPKATYAYSLEEVLAILKALDDRPVAKTVCAVAAFTGLRRSELRGLRWADLDDSGLHVRRTVWNSYVEEDTKTEESRKPVPVIPSVQKYLEEHRNGHPQDGFIFAGEKLGRPLNLANLAKRVIVPTLKEAGVPWHGWHAFRRALASNLYSLGAADKTIQAILRHANVKTTMDIYVKARPEASEAALRKLEKTLRMRDFMRDKKLVKLTEAA